MNLPTIQLASVRVMRSHDYCHFEITLGTSSVTGAPETDALRKEAMRLVDKSVEQYKAAKRNAELREDDDRAIERARYHAERAMKVPESERSPQQKAEIKVWEDFCHSNRPSRRSYDYEDDWEEQDALSFDDDDIQF